MGLGGKINDLVDVELLYRLAHRPAIANVPADEFYLISDIPEVIHVTGVRQLIVHQDIRPGIFLKDVMHEVGADEPGGARHH
jgi:hypothetical protein